MTKIGWLCCFVVLFSCAPAGASLQDREFEEEVEDREARREASAINRPDFKVRNLPPPPAAVSPAGASIGASFGAPSSPSFGVSTDTDAGAPSGFTSLIHVPSNEEILSAVDPAEILRYIDKADYEKRMSSAQQAQKYLGSAAIGASRGAADSLTLRWLMLSDSQQSAAKLNWFQISKSGISMEDFGREVDVRKYRVLLSIDSSSVPDLRKVTPPKRESFIPIEKLQLPGLRPLSEWRSRGELSSDRVRPSARVVSPVRGMPSKADVDKLYPRPRSGGDERPEEEAPPPVDGVLLPAPALRPILASPALPFPDPPSDMEFTPPALAVPPIRSEPTLPMRSAVKASPEDEPRREVEEKMPTLFGIPSALRNGP